MSRKKDAKRPTTRERNSRVGSRHAAKNTDVLALLSGGDRRSVGRANAVATMVLARPKLFRKLIRSMWDQEPVVRMRAADAAEKASRRKPELLRPFKAELLGLL